MMLKTRELFAGLYALEDERVRQFLVIGEERALLFDAGFADSGVLETVRALTDLPIDVVMTHGDPDHSGGLADFGSCRMNAGDWPLVQDGCGAFAAGGGRGAGLWRLPVSCDRDPGTHAGESGVL